VPIPYHEAITTFKYYSVDNRGNVETVKTSQVKLDKTAPESTCTVQPSFVDSATITFSGTDNVSGVLSIAWSTDDGATWNYTPTAHITGWGSKTLKWKATDYAGNQEQQHSATFTLLQPDNQPPITGDNISAGWTRGPYQIVLTAYDIISSVEGIYYSTDGSFPTTRYTGPFDFNVEGSHTIKFFAVDTRGNAEDVQSRQLQIDNTPPVSSSNAQAHYLGQANITLTASDSLSNISGLWIGRRRPDQGHQAGRLGRGVGGTPTSTW
jgi:hypothetical protein